MIGPPSQFPPDPNSVGARFRHAWAALSPDQTRRAGAPPPLPWASETLSKHSIRFAWARTGTPFAINVTEDAGMFQKILLPVDLTDRHERALDLAAEFVTSVGEVT